MACSPVKDAIRAREQALHALNCAIAAMMSFPPTDESHGAAVFFTSLALHRLAQADTERCGYDIATQWLERSLARGG